MRKARRLAITPHSPSPGDAFPELTEVEQSIFGRPSPVHAPQRPGTVLPFRSEAFAATLENLFDEVLPAEHRAVLRPVSAILMELSEEWEPGRAYLTDQPHA